MVMKICPNCLVGVSKANRLCHQCGHEMSKRPASKSQKTMPKRETHKLMLSVVLFGAILIFGYISIL